MDPKIVTDIAALFAAQMPHPHMDIVKKFGATMIVWGDKDGTNRWEITIGGFTKMVAVGPSKKTSEYDWKVKP